MEQKYIVALETGSSKIRGAIGCVDASGNLTVKAVEEERLTDCVRYGQVRNVAGVSQAVSDILSRLEQREPGRKINAVYAALGGKSTMLTTCTIERRLPAETEVTREHVEQLADEARSTVLNEREIIAVTPRGFAVDNAPTMHPEGEFGRTIEAEYNLVSCRNQLRRNLKLVLDKTGMEAAGFVPRQLALADLVLTDEEKRLGCMLVDFGAETVTVSVYKGGVLLYLATLPLGSRNITRDITTLHHLEEKAEHLKKNIGNAASGPGADGADYSEINALVAARAAEIIANIREQIAYARLTPDDLPAGIVITGGGAKLRGFNSALQKATGLQVRTGLPGSYVRIVDNRIQPVDAVDVIAILAAVARTGSSCMSEIEPEPAPEPEYDRPEHGKCPSVGTLESVNAAASGRIEPTPEEDYDDLDDDEDDYPAPKRRRAGKFFDIIKKKVAGLMIDDTEDDEFADMDNR